MASCTSHLRLIGSASMQLLDQASNLRLQIFNISSFFFFQKKTVETDFFGVLTNTDLMTLTFIGALCLTVKFEGNRDSYLHSLYM